MSVTWGLVDDRTGHTGQVLGVVAKLGRPYTLKRLEYNALARLPASLLGPTMRHVDRGHSAPMDPPFPPLVIAAGRRTLPVLRAIKQASPTTKTVYLMWPEVRRDLDLIVVPEHDLPMSAPNIITTVAPLHAVTKEALAAARDQWAPQLSHLPRPYVGLCLGGSTKQGSYSVAQWREVVERALALVGQGTLLVTTSRRTPKEAIAMCAPILDRPHLLYAWDTAKDNPYLGILALSDGIVVTGDSLSMCAEACATGAPVFIYASPNVTPPKHARLHQTLYDRGLAHPLNGMANLDWRPSAPLSDVTAVANAIRSRFPELFV